MKVGRPRKGEELSPEERAQHIKDYQKKYRDEHKEEKLILVKKWNEDNAEYVKEYRREYYRVYREKNKEKVQAYNHKSYLKKKAKK